MARRNRTPRPAAKPPTPPDLVLAPELAILSVLAYVLDTATAALLAEHPTLIDDFHRPHDDGPVVSLANTICRRAAHLGDSLAAYDRAVRDAVGSTDHAEADEDIPF
jgi:hypothetical protein